MRYKILGLLTVFVLFIGSCVEDPGNIPDPCSADDTGDLTIVNATSGVDGVPMRIWINGNDTGEDLSPGGQLYEGALAVGTYEIEGIEPNGITIYSKTVTLLQCEDLFVELGN